MSISCRVFVSCLILPPLTETQAMLMIQHIQITYKILYQVNLSAFVTISSRSDLIWFFSHVLHVFLLVKCSHACSLINLCFGVHATTRKITIFLRKIPTENSGSWYRRITNKIKSKVVDQNFLQNSDGLLTEIYCVGNP